MLNNKNKICVILGSGFSWYSGLPLANKIDFFFNRNNVDNLLRFSSGEWKWTEFANYAEKNNGSNYDNIGYGYIINELVNEFIKVKSVFLNYEEFYQFVIEKSKDFEFLQSIYSNAFDKFKIDRKVTEDNSFYHNYTFVFTRPDSKEIHNLINYLIADLLYIRRKYEEYKEFYFPFFSFINKYKNVGIVTLNHDFLLEAFFQRNNINYTDGFSNRKSPLQSHKRKKIKYFNGKFTKNPILIKLHGSIDMYKYIVAEQDGAILNPTGECIYYKTHDYWEKQMPKRINPENGNIIQDFHWNITPQFITGTRKDEIIANDYMYAELYKQFDSIIHNAETLLIIGYSYNDQHVNTKIQSAIETGFIKKIINVNPGKEFPFNSYNINTINHKDIQEIQ